MNVYLLYNEGIYDDYPDKLVGVYSLRAIAEAELPAARWVDGRATHPLYDIPWESDDWSRPYIVERGVRDMVSAAYVLPKGPIFGPPKPPGCTYRNSGSWQYCTRFAGHDGPHDLARGMWTSDSLIFTSATDASGAVRPV